jgi:hypothetical protein
MGVLCKGRLPMPKMVTKFFGKRHFVQPMGRPKHALKVPSFFSFYVLGWRGEESFFSFFLASQCVCTMFLSSSQWVPNIFPNIFSIPLHFYPIYALENGVLLSPIYVGQMGGIVQFKIEPFILGSLHFCFQCKEFQPVIWM